MVKTGRNDPCPCGSGKKYKKCHGSVLMHHAFSSLDSEAPMIRARLEAAQVQRERQQGLGRPIISVESHGQRLVAVGDQIYSSKNYKTFPDFLCNYIKVKLTANWGNAEIAKPLEERHPILVWYHYLCEHQRATIKVPGKVTVAPTNGAVDAYLHLAYDLYQLEHNIELQERLLARIRNNDNFYGARYEVQVAAMLIRAGFQLEFENEDDRSRTHCEFTATYTKTGKKFSVEAKHQSSPKNRIIGLLSKALNKSACHQRIIFIDINRPSKAINSSGSDLMRKSLSDLRRYEDCEPAAKSKPRSYVIITNTPWHHHLNQPTHQSALLAEGFRIPDFKDGANFPTLRHAINARTAHVEMHAFLKSWLDHSGIPSTFDGEIPEFAYTNQKPRLLIGERYMVPDENGVFSAGILASPVVIESEKVVHCGMNMDDGRGLICTMPISDLELEAWRRHPDTFFGVAEKRKTDVDTTLGMYDFLLDSYSKTTKELLVQLMYNHPDIAEISKLSQPELASIYSERMALSAMALQSEQTT
jgi:SEC-C motif